MDPVFKKLNFKEESKICVLNAPSEFEVHLASMQSLTEIHSTIRDIDYTFVLKFLQTEQELSELAQKIKESVVPDVKLWIAYPKKSSKKYNSEINRDSDWTAIGNLGYEGVRQIAIDEDWSALRFRQVGFIKEMKRDPKWAMTDEGKNRSR